MDFQTEFGEKDDYDAGQNRTGASPPKGGIMAGQAVSVGGFFASVRSAEIK